ncbi:NAD(P)-dependent malic enzyme [Bombilactobacillus bombi]|uniref:NAD(P)-dependent malic enzyme n=1 Tax=Bombilactobacillus bombi TaxID=1303590 RepID=UPI0015E5C442|nr:NADP-dependent malic enzyme [Bombilactobacillus bombi]MBA1434035.1 NADP-dependent malic enzyme [Bombilactobacillus bombi]
MSELEEILKLHALHTGVLDIKSDLDVTNRQELAQAYTPGVSMLSKQIEAHPELKDKYTMSGKLVALITDGTAVLGLGNIGPAAGLPVIEGKALLYKDLADINAIPIALNQVDIAQAVATIKNISLSFAGIHLEDIAAPRCFEIEEQLSNSLEIPVYHDDQEGTAIVVLAGLINAAKVVHKNLQDLHIVINGVGASGFATARLLYQIGIKHLVLVDKQGVITADDTHYNEYQRNLARKLQTPVALKNQPLAAVIAHQDVFIGLSDKNVLQAQDVQKMNSQPIIFALANPIPEIDPQIAQQAGAAVIATGSSKYPNQVNNILAFPGLFKGLLDSSITKVDAGLQKVVAQALAQIVTQPTTQKIIPDVFDKQVVATVSQAVQDYSQQQK